MTSAVADARFGRTCFQGPPPLPTELCQLIIGTFPSEANAFMPTASDCQVGPPTFSRAYLTTPFR